MRTYYNIYFKSPSMDAVSVPEDIYLKMRPAILNRQETLIEFNSQTFSPRDVRYVKRLDQPERVQEDLSEIPEEQRQENLRRLAVLRETFFSGRRVPAEDWVNPYYRLTHLARMTREELRAFDREFFDVSFDDHDQRDAAAGLWLGYLRGPRDPRDYSRDALVAQVKSGDMLH